jgi:uncharacterized Fe-S cluster-containing radical SAM superfamily protein
MLNYSDKDRADLRKLASDPRKVQVMCDLHMYCGDLHTQPTKGCADCWKAYYFTSLANTPPDQQKQFVEELEAVVRQLVELADKKKFDVAIDAHPTVEFS